MILPIYSYGHKVLKQKAVNVESNHPDLQILISNMFETMYNAQGVGLAAPQVGLPLRIFVVDAEPMDEKTLVGFKKVFLNAEIIAEDGEEWAYEEGCLSIPGIREDVRRAARIQVRYHNENFEEKIEWFEGLGARVIQHEYDHIEGVLFTDHLSLLRKRMLKNKLTAISKGECDASYRMRFFLK
jgi:peptide deformylase